jgi:hypothetical protein
MNATAAKTETVTCPKCFGGRTFAVWSHYAGGLCFRCNGAGVVDASAQTASTDSTDAVKAANVASAERQNAWLAGLSTDPKVVVAAFHNIGPAKLMAIRNACANINVRERDADREDRTPGARMAYWAASTVIGAWPFGCAYSADWIDAA